MAFFRSEEMSYCELLVHEQNAFECLVALGHLGKVQFVEDESDARIDMYFTAEVTRYHNMLKAIEHLEAALQEAGIEAQYYEGDDGRELLEEKDSRELEEAILQMRKEYDAISSRLKYLQHVANSKLERSWVIAKACDFLTSELGTTPHLALSDSETKLLLHDSTRTSAEHEQKRDLSLNYIAGSVPVYIYADFTRVLWRITNGNMIIKHDNIPVYLEDANVKVRKYAFMVFIWGDSLHKKVRKVCDGFRVELFECPETQEERHQLLKVNEQDLKDANIVLEESRRHRNNLLQMAAVWLELWKDKTTKLLYIYHTLNKFQHVHLLKKQKYYQIDCWIPKPDVNSVRRTLRNAAVEHSEGDENKLYVPVLTVQPMNDDMQPPTYYTLNKFTIGFQNLIDAYGAGAYRELNPAPYTIITFPFLFAVMFGDLGHGIILLIFSAWMVYNEKPLLESKRRGRKSNEIWDLLFAGRYIILLMGAFSIYTGLLYNDCFSKSINIVGSRWRVNLTEEYIRNTAHGHIHEHLHLDLDPTSEYLGTAYELGMDPVWEAAENTIQMTNSLKMKLAIILGVTQMYFGLCLSGVNHMLRKDKIELFLVFVPQMVFLCLFGYLVFLVFYKWRNFGGHHKWPHDSACAPSILLSFIGMILLDPPQTCDRWIYKGQMIVEAILLIFVLLSVPVLLLGKPLAIMYQRKKQKKEKQQREHEAAGIDKNRRRSSASIMTLEGMRTQQLHAGQRKGEDEDMFEVWLHQGIHCMESVLGSISHTASYLRLWALSLAHNQLSTVLWMMVLRHYKHWFFLYIAFAAWAILTVCVLVVMEGLSAFLHTLRLHWVEFQSKFYMGTGTLYKPFRFHSKYNRGSV